jgi:hypothetical protein
MRSESRLPRWSGIFSVSLATLIVLLFVSSSAGAAISSPFTAHNSVAVPEGSSAGPAPSVDSANTTVLARCLYSDYYLSADAYDPANGYIYAVGGSTSASDPSGSGIVIIKPPCTLVKLVVTGQSSSGYSSNPVGVVYDPVTKEMVVTDNEAPAIYVLRGTSIVKTLTLPAPANGGGNLAWDGSIDSVLIPDEFGVTVLHLELVNGKTRATWDVDRFDKSDASLGTGNIPVAELVADGYIFSAGNRVDVFNDRTLAYVGSFHHLCTGCDGGTESLAWDPVLNAVVLGGGTYSVAFLAVNSIASGKFAVTHLAYAGLLSDGVSAVVYSPATQKVYLTQLDGADVLMLSKSGGLTHVFLGNQTAGDLEGMAYDPVSKVIYVCAWGPPAALYVIG